MKIDRILGCLETGLGATRVSPRVESVVLTLSQRTRASGVRHFWRQHLRRIQFANPDLRIDVNFQREVCPATLEIKLAGAAAPEAVALAGLRSDDICRQFLAKAGASE
ncbi:hypothetical protein H4R19_005748 [Coemansia spiralis]|nr:hypothetical protein H4R19_005748 [Coemansia spiralis]